jgi:hypothetical protein
MPEPLLHLPDRDAAHHGVRGKGVAQDVVVDVAHADALGDLVEQRPSSVAGVGRSRCRRTARTAPLRSARPRISTASPWSAPSSKSTNTTFFSRVRRQLGVDENP